MGIVREMKEKIKKGIIEMSYFSKKRITMEKLKSEEGSSLSTLILIFLILVILAFLVYQVIYADIFGIITSEGKRNINVTDVNTIEFIPKYQNDIKVQDGQKPILQNVLEYGQIENSNYR